MSNEIISLDSPVSPETSVPSLEKLISGDPHQTLWNVFSSPDARFHLGRWASTSGAWRVRYSEYEFCHLLAGIVRLTADDGTSRVFRRGDSFMIKKEFSGIWEVLEPCEKLYVIYEPQASDST